MCVGHWQTRRAVPGPARPESGTVGHWAMLGPPLWHVVSTRHGMVISPSRAGTVCCSPKHDGSVPGRPNPARVPGLLVGTACRDGGMRAACLNSGDSAWRLARASSHRTEGRRFIRARSRPRLRRLMRRTATVHRACRPGPVTCLSSGFAGAGGCSCFILGNDHYRPTDSSTASAASIECHASPWYCKRSPPGSA